MRLKILASTLAASLLTLAGCQTRPTASPAPATPLVADGAMAIAQSAQAPMIEDWLPTPSPGAAFTSCRPEIVKPGHHCLSTRMKGSTYRAETWASRNFKGSKTCLTTIGEKGFQIDWQMDVYGFLNQVGHYDVSVLVDDLKDDLKGTHDHELKNITGGGGYTGLYGWLCKAATPEAVELYINDNWAGGPINMSDTTLVGSIDVDGAVYEIYTRPRRGVRVEQWWSNRVTLRTSGEISYAKHMQAWRKLGMPNMPLTRLTYAFEVRWGQPSSGSAVYKSFSIDKPVAR